MIQRILYLIFIMTSEVWTFPTLVIFSIVVCLICLNHDILSISSYRSRESFFFLVFIITAQTLVWTNNIMQTFLKALNMLFSYILSSVCLFSQLFLMVVRILVLDVIIIIKSDKWFISHEIMRQLYALHALLYSYEYFQWESPPKSSVYKVIIKYDRCPTNTIYPCR